MEMRIDHSKTKEGHKCGDKRIIEKFIYLPFYDIETNTTYWLENIRAKNEH
jgi:hypothetical protein